MKKRQTWQASSRSMSINRLHPSLCIDGIPHADQLRRNSTADKPTAKCQFYHDSVRSSRCDQVRRYFGCAGFGCVAFSWNWGMLTRMLACLLACWATFSQSGKCSALELRVAATTCANRMSSATEAVFFFAPALGDSHPYDGRSIRNISTATRSRCASRLLL